MSHHLYTTEGFILGSVGTGESHLYITIFTREFGLVRAVARSARVEKSKLRYNLQEFSQSNISLVRGRDVWRITGAQEGINTYWHFGGNEEKIKILARISSLLKRLLHGEEKNEQLFLTISTGVKFLREQNPDSEIIKNFEYLIVLKILSILGYVKEIDNFDLFLATTDVDTDLLLKVTPFRSKMALAINEALNESQL